MGIGNVTERRMQPPQVGVSVVILTLAPAPSGSRLWLPLVRRTRQPFLGRWALPGGGLRADRSLEESAYYALVSTTDLHPRYLEQLYTFGDPARSQGGLPMVSIAYWALVGREETDDLSEAENVRWFPVDALPELAFDHRRIIEAIRECDVDDATAVLHSHISGTRVDYLEIMKENIRSESDYAVLRFLMSRNLRIASL